MRVYIVGTLETPLVIGCLADDEPTPDYFADYPDAQVVVKVDLQQGSGYVYRRDGGRKWVPDLGPVVLANARRQVEQMRAAGLVFD